MKRLSRRQRDVAAPLVGIVVTMILLSLVGPGLGEAVAQDEQPTPTPIPTPTAVPSFAVSLDRELPPGGAVGPGATLTYTATVTNLSGQDTGPVELAVRFNDALVASVLNISEGGSQAEAGEVIWAFPDGFGADEPPRLVKLQVTLKSSFPPGRNVLSANALLRAGNVEVARASTQPIEIQGPILQLDDVRLELQEDANVSGRLDAGDTVRVIVLFSNSGGTPAQNLSVVSDYPEELVAQIVDNPDGGLDDGRAITWSFEAIPADSQSRQVQFDMRLLDEFPAGVTSVPVPTLIRSGGAVRDELALEISVSGVSTVLEGFVCPLTLDQDDDKLADPDDELKCQITLSNLGDLDAGAVTVSTRFDAAVLDIITAEDAAGTPGNVEIVETDEGPQGTVTWQGFSVGAGQTVSLAFSARVLTPREGQLASVVAAKVERADASPIEVEVEVPLDEAGAPSTESELVQILQPEQGTGSLKEKPVLVTMLLGGFLIVSLLSIAVLTLRVLTIVEDDDRPALINTIFETLLLSLVLFAVMLLGLQNAIDRQAINSIIGGIVGYVGGRVVSRVGKAGKPAQPPGESPGGGAGVSGASSGSGKPGGTSGLMPSP